MTNKNMVEIASKIEEARQLPLEGFDTPQRPLSSLGGIVGMGQTVWQMLRDPFPNGKYWMETRPSGHGVKFTKISDPVELVLRERGLKI